MFEGVGRQHSFTVEQARRLSRGRKIALLRASYRNAKEYLALSKVAHQRRMYGKAYAIAVLGLEQVGATIFWNWMTTGAWDKLPAEFQKHLAGEGKAKSVIADHAKKQAAVGFALQVLFYYLAHGVELKRSRHESVEVYARRAARRNYLLGRIYAHDFEGMQDRKFRGLYVDPEPRRLRTPWEIKAGESKRVIDLLNWLVSLYRNDVRSPSTPLQTKQLETAMEATGKDLEGFLAATKNPTPAQLQRYVGKVFETHLREAMRPHNPVSRTRPSTGEEE
jgi:AbiV family abortive infection protein